MENLETFPSIIAFLDAQLVCRKKAPANQTTRTIKITTLPESLDSEAPKKESLKKIKKRIEDYITGYKDLSLSPQEKTQAIHEAKFLNLKFNKILKTDKSLHKGKDKIIDKLYRFIFQINTSKIKNHIKNTFNDENLDVQNVTFDETNFHLSELSKPVENINEPFYHLSSYISLHLNAVFENSKLNYNIFLDDAGEALLRALTDKREIPLAFLIKDYLLKILEEKYSPILEEFTEEQIADVQTQWDKTHSYTMIQAKRTNEHDYVDYDETTLKDAIQAYKTVKKFRKERGSESHPESRLESILDSQFESHLNSRFDSRFESDLDPDSALHDHPSHTPLPFEFPDFDEPSSYPMLHFRTPGSKPTRADYDTLKSTLINLMQQPETVSNIEILAPFLRQQINEKSVIV